MIEQPSAADRNGPPAANPDAWLGAVSARLAKSGLNARVNPAGTGLKLSAVLQRPERRATELTLSEDGYAELRWWNDFSSTPAQVTTVIIRAVTAVTAIPPAAPPP